MGMERIKQRRDFLAAARASSSAKPGLVLQARDRGDKKSARIGLTATRKLGNAVARNRVKRRLRAAAEAVLGEIAVAGFDYVLIGRGATADRSFEALKADLRKAFVDVHATPSPRKPSRRPGTTAKTTTGKPAGEQCDVRRS